MQSAFVCEEAHVRIQLDGFEMAYDEAGSGRTVLLIHGYPLSRRLWRPQLAGLSNAARLIAPDLRGFGESDPPAATNSVEQMADDCAALLDAVGVSEPVVVGGLSMGGYVALAFWRRHAARVAGLILAATRAGADSEAGKQARDQAAATAREQGREAIIEGMLPKLLAPGAYDERPEVVAEARATMAEASVPGILGALRAMRDRPDATGDLGGIDRPVLVIHGTEDGLLPPAEAEAMHSALPHSRLTLVANAGHLVNLEQPDEFNGAVRDFLAGL